MATNETPQVIESGYLVIELQGIIGECALLAMQCVRDAKSGDKTAEAYERRTQAWRSIARRVADLDKTITRSNIRPL